MQLSLVSFEITSYSVSKTVIALKTLSETLFISYPGEPNISRKENMLPFIYFDVDSFDTIYNEHFS